MPGDDRAVGSSPRLRGTLVKAGIKDADRAVHPRACGERVVTMCGLLAIHGSSPRLRGTHVDEYLVRQAKRFIPAPAGNASAAWRRAAPAAVHPRACGERESSIRCAFCLAGSSPRLRGTPRFFAIHRGQGRFIPAPAGNARAGGMRSGGRSVHPRACGERRKTRAILNTPNGSSPRLRGTRWPARPSSCKGRFIPAPAGNASRLKVTAMDLAVHPRACGERLNAASRAPWPTGSSPRLRGTPRHRRCRAL